MRHLRKLSVIIVVLLAPIAAAQPPAKKEPAPSQAQPQTPSPQTPAKAMATPEESAQAEKFFNDFADAVVKNQSSCPKMGAAINKLIDKNEAWLMKMAETDKELPQASKDKIQKRQTEMMDAVMKCKDDKDVTAAFQRFATIAMKKQPPGATGGAGAGAGKTPPQTQHGPQPQQPHKQ
ncbi:MAG: hypothetical protein KF773_13490 [Deltaproteobacteria bacterium]|nr:hypothetical protein [Deltaproteobacteria bacterium]MCW5803356.1 hypothetical protein [Deltaproteobacteria bacterium]